MAMVHPSLSSGGRIVRFAGGDERVTCNGHDLAQEGAFASFEALQAPAAQVAGTTVHCQYTAGGAIAGISLQIPAAPAITSPQMGAQVVRSAQTPVTYIYDSATTTMLGIVALTAAPASPPNKAIARLNTSAPLHATLDTSGFAAGPGSLVLTATLQPRITETGVPFKSASTGGNASIPISITWV